MKTVMFAYKNYKGEVRQFTVKECPDPDVAGAALEAALETTVAWVSR